MSDSDALANFLAITGAEPDAARYFLEASGGDVGAAVALFFDNPTAGSGGGGGGPSRPAPLADDTARAPMATGHVERMADPVMPHGHVQHAFNLPSQAPPRAGFDGALDTMLKEPPHYSFDGSLREACDEGKMTQRWVLVNVVSEGDWSSMQMNRDLWKDEGLAQFIQAGFVFWHATDSSDDTRGMWFIQAYHPSTIPCLCLLCPVTRRVLKTFNLPSIRDTDGLFSPEILSEQLLTFTERTRIPQSGSSPASAPVSGVASGTVSPLMPPPTTPPAPSHERVVHDVDSFSEGEEEDPERAIVRAALLASQSTGGSYEERMMQAAMQASQFSGPGGVEEEDDPALRAAIEASRATAPDVGGATFPLGGNDEDEEAMLQAAMKASLQDLAPPASLPKPPARGKSTTAPPPVPKASPPAQEVVSASPAVAAAPVPVPDCTPAPAPAPPRQFAEDIETQFGGDCRLRLRLPKQGVADLSLRPDTPCSALTEHVQHHLLARDGGDWGSVATLRLKFGFPPQELPSDATTLEAAGVHSGEALTCHL